MNVCTSGFTNVWSQFEQILAEIDKESSISISDISNFHRLEIVTSGSETQLQVYDNFNCLIWRAKGQY